MRERDLLKYFKAEQEIERIFEQADEEYKRFKRVQKLMFAFSFLIVMVQVLGLFVFGFYVAAKTTLIERSLLSFCLMFGTTTFINQAIDEHKRAKQLDREYREFVKEHEDLRSVFKGKVRTESVN